MKNCLENLCGKRLTGTFRHQRQDDVGKDVFEREQVGMNASELLRVLQDLLN
jgi:hypothetical protein